MVVCAVLWSTSGIIMKFINWNAFLIAGGRAVFSTSIIAVSTIKTGHKLKITKMGLWAALLSFLNVNCFIAANKLTTAANSIVLQYTAPIFVLIITAFILKKKLKVYEYASVFLALAGMILFFMDDMDMNGMLGNLLAVTSGFFMGIMMVLNGQIEDEGERMTSILIGHGSVAVIGVPIGLILTDVQAITGREILLVVFLGLFQLGIPYILYGKAAGMISAVACSLISMIEPMLNPVWVALFYDEVPGRWALVGAIIIIGAVVMYSVLDRDPEERVPADVEKP